MEWQGGVTLNLNKYRELTSQYDQFIFESYYIEDLEEKLMLNYQYKLVGSFGKPLIFNHRISYTLTSKTKKLELSKIKELDALIFTIGLVEGINYYKTVCPREFFVNCGRLTKAQKLWWQKLYYHGLGEFIYLNGLSDEVSENNFVHFADDEQMPNDFEAIELPVTGNLIPIGGGKDSVVTLELLAYMKEDNLPFVMSPPQAAYDCIKVAGYNDYLLAKRHFDKELFRLNEEGYLNGHVPFSAILGFIALFGAALTGKKYIPLSNERSANESTVIGETYNHQYSKSYEFEKDFNDYVNEFLLEDIKYFSLLRPLYEVEIAQRFANYKAYHSVFRSCNRGKKDNSWCGICSKCLFVTIILAPFMSEEALFEIFGRDLLNDQQLEPILIELLGMTDKKPFECVGTIDEVKWSMKKNVENYRAANKPLPYLVRFFDENFDLSQIEVLDVDEVDNSIPEIYAHLLKG